MSETREERWDICTLNGRIVATRGAPAPGVEMRSLAGMCDLANALEQERDELRALVDEAATAMRWLDGHPTAGWRTTDWLARYDSLIQEGK